MSIWSIQETKDYDALVQLSLSTFVYLTRYCSCCPWWRIQCLCASWCNNYTCSLEILCSQGIQSQTPPLLTHHSRVQNHWFQLFPHWNGCIICICEVCEGFSTICYTYHALLDCSSHDVFKMAREVTHPWCTPDLIPKGSVTSPFTCIFFLLED